MKELKNCLNVNHDYSGYLEELQSYRTKDEIVLGNSHISKRSTNSIANKDNLYFDENKHIVKEQTLDQ